MSQQQQEKKIIGKIPNSIINKYSMHDCENKNIVVYADRYIHFEGHKHEYINESSYNKSINSLGVIITSPDFVYENVANNSYEFYKKLDENVCLAVRISKGKDLKIRTLFPITEAKLNKRKNNS